MPCTTIKTIYIYIYSLFDPRGTTIPTMHFLGTLQMARRPDAEPHVLTQSLESTCWWSVQAEAEDQEHPKQMIKMQLPVKVPERVGPIVRTIVPQRPAGTPRQWDRDMKTEFGKVVPFNRDRSPGMQAHTGHSESPIRSVSKLTQDRSRSRSRSQGRRVVVGSTQEDIDSESIATTEPDQDIVVVD